MTALENVATPLELAGVADAFDRAEAELASVGAVLGRIPTPEEYMTYARKIDSMADDIYRYMNFDQIVEFQKSAEEGKRIAAVEIQEMRA